MTSAPIQAQCILDVGCSNGSLDEALKQTVPGRGVFGIDFYTSLCQEAAIKFDEMIQSVMNHFNRSQHFMAPVSIASFFADVLEHLIEHCLDGKRRYRQYNNLQ
jgi:2-polyprenyl-3-methyl-5-hydroxy-6-metoxy-1,4-benzoquinol methylase